MSERFLKPIRQGEKRLLVFDLSDDLAADETLTGTPVVAIDVDYGTDANPDALKNGLPAIDSTGTKVAVPVIGAIDGCDYGVAVTCETTNQYKAPSLRAVLSIRNK